MKTADVRVLSGSQFSSNRWRARPTPTPKLRIRNPPKGPAGPKASVYTEVVPAKTI